MVEEQSIYLTEDKGVAKKILIEGDEGPLPETGEECLVHYKGTLTDGTEFDCSYKREPLKLSVGTGQVIKGWDIGIASMKVGEKAELTIDSEYGYGANGSPPSIPGGATLVFTVDLVQCGKRKAASLRAKDVESFEKAQKHKDEGNDFFKNKDFPSAIGKYEEALKNLKEVEELDEEMQKLAVIICQNISVCLNNQKRYKEVIIYCNDALEKNPSAVKAYYQRSIAKLNEKDFDGANDDIKNAIKLMPQDKNLRAHFEIVKKAKLEGDKDKAKAMQAMFA